MAAVYPAGPEPIIKQFTFSISFFIKMTFPVIELSTNPKVAQKYLSNQRMGS
jgi:hypothetical protein